MRLRHPELYPAVETGSRTGVRAPEFARVVGGDHTRAIPRFVEDHGRVLEVHADQRSSEKTTNTETRCRHRRCLNRMAAICLLASGFQVNPSVWYGAQWQHIRTENNSATADQLLILPARNNARCLQH